MEWKDVEEVARAVGWPSAIFLVVAFVLTKNGWWKLIMRGEREDEISSIRSDLREVKAGQKVIMERMRLVETDVAVLNERTKHE